MQTVLDNFYGLSGWYSLGLGLNMIAVKTADASDIDVNQNLRLS